MKRGRPLARGKGLKRGKPLGKGGGPARENKQRKARKRRRDFGAHAQTVRSLPCTGCGSRFGVQSHHEPPRSCGGTAKDQLPLCWTCHDERHRVGREEFERRHDVDLIATAARLWAARQEEAA